MYGLVSKNLLDLYWFIFLFMMTASNLNQLSGNIYSKTIETILIDYNAFFLEEGHFRSQTLYLTLLWQLAFMVWLQNKFC